MDNYTDKTTHCDACGCDYLYPEKIEKREPSGVFGYDQRWVAFACPQCHTRRSDWIPQL